MRIVLIGFAVCLIILTCGLAVKFGQDANYARSQLDNERYKRMVFEENLQEVNKQVNSLSTELELTQSKIETTALVLEKTKAINTELKNRLKKATETQISLDLRISELQQMVRP